MKALTGIFNEKKNESFNARMNANDVKDLKWKSSMKYLFVFGCFLLLDIDC